MSANVTVLAEGSDLNGFFLEKKSRAPLPLVSVGLDLLIVRWAGFPTLYWIVPKISLGFWFEVLVLDARISVVVLA